MKKTNEERARKVMEDFATEIVGELGLQSDLLISKYATALDKEYKRGQSKERKRNTKYSVEESGVIGKVLFEYDDNGNEVRRYYLHKCEDENPRARRTVEDAERLAALLVGAAYGVAEYNSIENQAKLKQARQNVIDAISSNVKPQPQFDMEKVRGLIIAYGKYRTARANTKSFIVDDCATMQTAYHKLLTALQIEDKQ